MTVTLLAVYGFLLMFNRNIDVTLPVLTLSAKFGDTLSEPILLHYRPIDFVTLSVSYYIIGKFGVTLLLMLHYWALLHFRA